MRRNWGLHGDGYSPYEAEVRTIDIRLVVTGCVIAAFFALWIVVVFS